MAKFYREWVTKLNRRCGNMVPVELTGKILARHNPGYTSVYLFAEQAALEIAASGVSQGFSRYQPAASSLVIDLDTDSDAQLATLEMALAALGCAYKVYSSGRKGFHVDIPHQFVEDFRLPYSHKHFVETLGIKADFSLYRPNSLVALPGRIHPKTGNRKELVKTVEGNTLSLNIVEEPPKEKHARFDFSDEMPEFNKRVTGLFMLATLAGSKPEMGDRHNLIWKTAKMLYEGGFSQEAIEALIVEIAELWPIPKDPEESRAAISQAFHNRKSPRGSSKG